MPQFSLLRSSIWYPTVAIMLTILGLGGPGVASSDDGQPELIPPHIPAFGTTYAELAGAWWNWGVNQPPETNPITDETGEDCAVGQEEDFGQGDAIFFLAGTFGGSVVRQCEIPEDTEALFFPILNSLWWAPEDCPEGAPECRRQANAAINAVVTLDCTINGVAVEDLFAYRAQTPPGGFGFEVRKGSYANSPDGFGLDPRGPTPGAVADGYWLLVELGDLDEGDELLINFTGVSANLETSVEYLLTVGDDDDD